MRNPGTWCTHLVLCATALRGVLVNPRQVAQAHYGDPCTLPGCLADEHAAVFTGVTGAICAPPCEFGAACPTDVPAGVTATPTCSKSSVCVLVCSPPTFYNTQCADGASCRSTPDPDVDGICTYNDCGPTPAPIPTGPTPTPVTPAPIPVGQTCGNISIAMGGFGDDDVARGGGGATLNATPSPAMTTTTHTSSPAHSTPYLVITCCSTRPMTAARHFSTQTQSPFLMCTVCGFTRPRIQT
jgi:hypothetical protein